MRTFTTEHTVYTFNELSNDAKQNAMDKLRDINTDREWWDGDIEWFNEDIFSPYGITVDDINFDLDRGAWVDFQTVEIKERTLLKKLGYDLRSKLAQDVIRYGISVQRNHYAMGVFSTYFEVYDIEDTAESLELQNKINATWDDLKSEILKKLRDEYEYLTSDEAIIETIEANDYEFYEDGRLA